MGGPRSGSLTGPADREQAAVGLLDRLPADLRGVLIGGYAVSAYGPPRYSVDLDLVVAADTHEPLEGWLDAQGFGLEKRWKSRAEGSTATVSRWRLGLLVVDLLGGAVRDREAAADVGFARVARQTR